MPDQHAGLRHHAKPLRPVSNDQRHLRRQHLLHDPGRLRTRLPTRLGVPDRHLPTLSRLRHLPGRHRVRVHSRVRVGHLQRAVRDGSDLRVGLQLLRIPLRRPDERPITLRWMHAGLRRRDVLWRVCVPPHPALERLQHLAGDGAPRRPPRRRRRRHHHGARSREPLHAERRHRLRSSSARLGRARRGHGRAAALRPDALRRWWLVLPALHRLARERQPRAGDRHQHVDPIPAQSA